MDDSQKQSISAGAGAGTAYYFGLGEALGAALVWGVVPIYYKLLAHLDATEVTTYRVIWSVPILLLILWFRGNLVGVASAFADAKTRNFLLLSSFFIGGNWLIYIIAINTEHVLAASLGYFINPLLNVLLAMLILKERINRTQGLSIAIAAIGVAVLAVQAWDTLWISMGLAGFWAGYALLRKVMTVGPMAGLAAETILLTPFCFAYLFWLDAQGQGSAFHSFGSDEWLLIGSAAVTAFPLLLFNSAVKKIDFVTISLIQYIAPTIQFFIGWLMYKEPLTASHIICFTLIWISLAIFTGDAIRAERARRMAVAAGA